MSESDLFDGQLQKPASAIAYGISHKLAELCPGRAVLEARNEWFDLQQFAAAGHCTVAVKPDVHSQIETRWTGPGEHMLPHDCMAWYSVQWRGHTIEVVTAVWHDFPENIRWQWIVTANMDVARDFFDAVCQWCHETRGDVLVYCEGEWEKSADMSRAIATAGLDSLVLQGTMKQDLVDDFEQFLAARRVYEEYGVPWKRGALFLGPPGNGKTHCVKALVNTLKVPCLYVQSFKACYRDEQAGMKTVFQRARKSTPCLLVLEDIDALVASGARAFLLNELDGFSENSGLITLATSNHPERLDASIVDRPSRFDRKYFFGPPGPAERQAYLSLWQKRFVANMHVAPETVWEIAELTEDFSFAYLKELVLSSLMAHIAKPAAGGMGEIMRGQVAKLREQMATDSGSTEAEDAE